MFGQGANLLNQAGNTSGLVQQQLDASRAMADPFEARQRNQLDSKLFAQGRLDSTGGHQQFGDLLQRQGSADQQRIMNAQQTGLQNQQQLGQMGLGAMGQGNTLMGNNIGAFGQNFGGFQNAMGQGMQAEGQGFSQMGQALGMNQSAGQNRLQNAMGMFNLGSGAQNTGFNQGLAGMQGLGNQQSIQNQLFLGSLNADANRIGAQGQFADAQAQLGNARAEAAGSMWDTAGSFFSGFSDVRLKNNITRIGTLGDFGWYTWDWNEDAKLVGADKQPSYGVIAQEVAKTRPEAIGSSSGYLTVDYRGIY